MKYHPQKDLNVLIRDKCWICRAIKHRFHFVASFARQIVEEQITWNFLHVKRKVDVLNSPEVPKRQSRKA